MENRCRCQTPRRRHARIIASLSFSLLVETFLFVITFETSKVKGVGGVRKGERGPPGGLGVALMISPIPTVLREKIRLISPVPEIPAPDFNMYPVRVSIQSPITEM